MLKRGPTWRSPVLVTKRWPPAPRPLITTHLSSRLFFLPCPSFSAACSFQAVLRGAGKRQGAVEGRELVSVLELSLPRLPAPPSDCDCPRLSASVCVCVCVHAHTLGCTWSVYICVSAYVGPVVRRSLRACDCTHPPPLFLQSALAPSERTLHSWRTQLSPQGLTHPTPSHAPVPPSRLPQCYSGGMTHLVPLIPPHLLGDGDEDGDG